MWKCTQLPVILQFKLELCMALPLIILAVKFVLPFCTGLLPAVGNIVANMALHYKVVCKVNALYRKVKLAQGRLSWVDISAC